jgi:hypothetical protein
MDETATALIPEIVQDDYPQFFLEAIANKKIEQSEVKPILEEFKVSVSLFGISEKTRAIVVTDETQTDLMSDARELRLRLKAERVRIGKVKKEIKEPYLRKTQVIDGIHLIIERMFESEEQYLQDQEDFAKICEQQRSLDRAKSRSQALREYNFTGDIPGLGNIPAANFELILAGAKAKSEQAQAVEDQLHREEQERDEQAEKLRLENERLRQEKEEANRLAEAERVERQRIEDQARSEREAAEQTERDRLAAEETERKRVAAEARAKELAPDREKFMEFAGQITQLEMNAPVMDTDETENAIRGFRKRLDEISMEVREYAMTLPRLGIVQIKDSEVPF